MASLPKRVWSNKKLVYSNHKPVWKLDDKVWVYDPKFKEVETWETYTDERENLDWDAEMQIYDTMKPTDIWTMNSWIVATYTFYDYDEETVLKTGTVKDGWTPTAPTDPTREWYTFTWRDPTVWPISKDTSYVAQYEENVEPEPDPEEPVE